MVSLRAGIFRAVTAVYGRVRNREPRGGAVRGRRAALRIFILHPGVYLPGFVQVDFPYRGVVHWNPDAGADGFFHLPDLRRLSRIPIAGLEVFTDLGQGKPRHWPRRLG